MIGIFILVLLVPQKLPKGMGKDMGCLRDSMFEDG